jgi:ATP-dependent Clp protease ATP-binding subunit ClpA
MGQIIDIVVNETLKKMSDRQITIELSENAKDYIVEKGFDPVFGARPLKRVIQKYVEDALAEEILKGRFDDGSQIKVHKGEGDALEFVEVSRKRLEKRGRVAVAAAMDTSDDGGEPAESLEN